MRPAQTIAIHLGRAYAFHQCRLVAKHPVLKEVLRSTSRLSTKTQAFHLLQGFLDHVHEMDALLKKYEKSKFAEVFINSNLGKSSILSNLICTASVDVLGKETVSPWFVLIFPVLLRMPGPPPPAAGYRRVHQAIVSAREARRLPGPVPGPRWTPRLVAAAARLAAAESRFRLPEAPARDPENRDECFRETLPLLNLK
jgi:hypothetical protein